MRFSMSSLSLLRHAPPDAVSHLLGREAALPARADAVVIGGGIMGASTAWYLAQAGLRVVLLDRSRIASQQSGRNWGFVRSLCRDPKELDLAGYALSLWPGLSAELGAETGWRRSGCVFLSGSEAEHQSYGDWLRDAGDRVTDTRLLSPAEVQARFPGLRNSGHGAIIAESDGQAEPTLATSAFARAAARAGALVIEDCGTEAIETTAGQVSGVVTEHGTIRTGVVICAAGSETWRLTRGLTPNLPQKVVRSTVSLTEPVADLGLPCFVGLGLGLRQRTDGSCILATDSGTDIDITLDSFRASRFFLGELLRNRKSFSLSFGRPFWDDLHARLFARQQPRDPAIPANLRRAEATRALFTDLFGLPAPAIVKSWAGNIDVMPDALPVIDGALPTRGLVIATGFSGHGFGLGPGVGKALAALVAGRTPEVDLKAFAADRFARGTYSRPYATI